MKKKTSLMEILVILSLIIFLAWSYQFMHGEGNEGASVRWLKDKLTKFGDQDAHAQSRQVVSPLLFAGSPSYTLTNTAVAYTDPIAVWASERFALQTILTDGVDTDVDISWQAGTSASGTFYGWTGVATVLKEAASASEYRLIDTSKGHIAPYVRIKYEGSGSHSTVVISGNLIHK